MGIRDEIQSKHSSKKKRRWILIVILVIAIAGAALWKATTGSSEEVQLAPHIVEYGDLRTVIEAEGSIKGNDTMNLSFSLAEKLTEVYVQPGDTVAKGDLLAEIDARNYEIAIARNANSVQQARSNAASLSNPLKASELTSLQEQRKLQELALEQVQVSNNQRIQQRYNAMQSASLQLEQLLKDLQDVTEDNDVELAQKSSNNQIASAEINLQNSVSDTRSIMDTVMREIDLFLGLSDINRDANDAYQGAISAQNPALAIQAKRDRHALNNQRSANGWETAADPLQQQLQELIALTIALENVVDNTIETSAFSATQILALGSTFGSYRSSLTLKQSAITAASTTLDSARSSAESAVDTINDAQKDQIDALQAQIKTARITYEQSKSDRESAQQDLPLAIGTAEAQLGRTLADIQTAQSPQTASERASQQLQIAQGSLAVAEAQYNAEKTKLYATHTGTILTIENVVGEYPSPQFITMAIDANKYVEILIEEEEVNNIRIGQKVYLELDAIEDQELTGEVYYVSSAGTRDLNDIVQYQVLIKLLASDLSAIRTEMTVNASFVLDEKIDVLMIPLEYITSVDDATYVTLSGEVVQEVWLGTNNTIDAHLISGIMEGENIYLPSTSK